MNNFSFQQYVNRTERKELIFPKSDLCQSNKAHVDDGARCCRHYEGGISGLYEGVDNYGRIFRYYLHEVDGVTYERLHFFGVYGRLFHYSPTRREYCIIQVIEGKVFSIGKNETLLTLIDPYHIHLFNDVKEDVLILDRERGFSLYMRNVIDMFEADHIMFNSILENLAHNYYEPLADFCDVYDPEQVISNSEVIVRDTLDTTHMPDDYGNDFDTYVDSILEGFEHQSNVMEGMEGKHRTLDVFSSSSYLDYVSGVIDSILVTYDVHKVNDTSVSELDFGQYVDQLLIDVSEQPGYYRVRQRGKKKHKKIKLTHSRIFRRELKRFNNYIESDLCVFVEQGKTHKNKKTNKNYINNKKKERNVSRDKNRNIKTEQERVVIFGDNIYDDFINLNIDVDNSHSSLTADEISEKFIKITKEQAGRNSNLLSRLNIYSRKLDDNSSMWHMIKEVILIVTTVELVANSETLYLQMCALTNYFTNKLFDNKSLLRYVLDSLYQEYDFVPDAEEEIQQNSDLPMDDNDVSHQEHSFDATDLGNQGFLSPVRAFIRSSNIRHTSVILTGLATLGFIGANTIEVGSFKLLQYNALTPKDDGLDFLDRVFDAIDYFLDRGWQCLKTASFKPLLYGDDDLTALVNMTSECRTGITPYKQGNYAWTFGADPSVYDNLIQKTKEKLDFCLSIYVKDMPKKIVEEQRSRFAKVWETYNALKRTQSSRVAPFFVNIYGGSGVGKSSICTYTNNAILNFNGYLNDPEHTVYLSMYDKYDSNARTNVTTYILDDLANTRADKAQKIVNELIIKLKNNVPNTATMAEAEDKGKIFFEPKLLVGTTNNKTLDASYWSVSARSVLRRIDMHVNVKVRPQYMVDDMLNAPASDKIEDYWLITIDEPTYSLETITGWKIKRNPIPDTHPTMKLSIPCGALLLDISIFDYLKLLCYMSSMYYIKQNSVIDHINRTPQLMKACECCKLPIQCCMQVTPPTFNASNMDNQSAVTLVGSIVAGRMVDKYTTAATDWISDLYNRMCVQPFEWRILDSMGTSALLASYTTIENPILTLMHNILPTSIIQSEIYKLVYHYMRRHDAHKYATMAFYATLFFVVCLQLYLMSPFNNDKNLVFHKWWYVLPIVFYITNFYIYKLKIKNILEKRDDTVQEFMKRASKKMSKYKADHDAAAWNALASASFIGLSAGAILLVLKLIRSSNIPSDVQMQTLLDPKDDKDIQKRNNVPNVWNSVNNYIVGTGTSTGPQVCNMIKGNSMHIKYNNGKTTGNCAALFVKTGYVMMPYHVWFEDAGATININRGQKIPMMEFTFTRDIKTVGAMVRKCATFSTVIYLNQVKRIGETDLCIAAVNVGGDFKDIVHLFPEVYTKKLNTAAIYQRRLEDGTFVNIPCSVTNTIVNYERESEWIVYNGGTVESKYTFMKGDCAGVYVADCSKPLILGLHLMGMPTGSLYDKLRNRFGNLKGVYGTVTQNEVIGACQDLSISGLHLAVNQSFLICDEVVGEKIIVDQSDKCLELCKYVSPEKFDIIGTMGAQCTYRTQYTKSFLYGAITEKFGECTVSPPPFGRVKTWDPFDKYLKNINNSMSSLDSKYLTMAMNDYISGFLPLLKNSPVRQHIKPLNDEEILNGKTGVRFLDPMNWNTSIGFPFKGTKRQHILQESKPDGSVVSSFTNTNILESMKHCENDLLKGNGAMLLFTACLKDEILPETKNGKFNDKIRVFLAAGIMAQLLVRKYFLPVGMLMSTHPLISECAVGINCFGPEYEELTQFLTAHGSDRIMCGDYKAWDQMLSVQLTSAAWQVLIMIAHMSGNYGYDELRIMEGIAVNITRPLVNVNSVLVRIHGSNPSGQNMTSYINSICNCLLVRYVFYKKHGTSLGTNCFRKYIHNITYGDDIKMNVSSKIEFGFNYYKTSLAELNIVFTAADKVNRDVYPDYMEEREASFLKRLTVTVPTTNIRVGALEMASIYKSLYYLKSSSIGPVNVTEAIMQSALHEMFFHGKEQYERFRLDLMDICSTGPKTLYVRGMEVAYDDKLSEWREKYRTPDCIHSRDEE